MLLFLASAEISYASFFLLLSLWYICLSLTSWRSPQGDRYLILNHPFLIVHSATILSNILLPHKSDILSFHTTSQDYFFPLVHCKFVFHMFQALKCSIFLFVGQPVSPRMKYTAENVRFLTILSITSLFICAHYSSIYERKHIWNVLTFCFNIWSFSFISASVIFVIWLWYKYIIISSSQVDMLKGFRWFKDTLEYLSVKLNLSTVDN